MILKRFILIVIVVLYSCNNGPLKVVCDLPKSLNEVSGMAISNDQQTFWMIEDSGNQDHIYSVTKSGEITQEINLDKSVRNKDWEALISDNSGNLYIGDFGNNNKKRKAFEIYKVAATSLTSIKPAPAQKISFKLPKKQKALDFEAFILLNNVFYIFSKERAKTSVWAVPNKPGTHTAVYHTTFLFNEKESKITGATITKDQSTIALLNHDKVWILKDFSENAIFEGTIIQIPFLHKSQKEALCFDGNNTLYITDERVKIHGGNLYQLEF